MPHLAVMSDVAHVQQHHCLCCADVLTIVAIRQGAAGIANLLFGDANPSARLPVSFVFNNYTREIQMTDMRMSAWPGNQPSGYCVVLPTPWTWPKWMLTQKDDSLMVCVVSARPNLPPYSGTSAVPIRTWAVIHELRVRWAGCCCVKRLRQNFTAHHLCASPQHRCARAAA